MKLFAWAEDRMRVLRWYHISLIKLASAAFALMLAKLWPPLLAAGWEVYLIVTLVAAAPVYVRMFRKK